MILFKTENIEAVETDGGFITFDCPSPALGIRDLLLYIQRIEMFENPEGNLNGLRQKIALAMRDSKKTVNISLETAQSVIVECEKHQVAVEGLKEQNAKMRDVLIGLRARYKLSPWVTLPIDAVLGK